MTRLLMRPFKKSIGAQMMAGYGIATVFALVVAAISIASVIVVYARLSDIADIDRQVGAHIGRVRLAIEQQNDGLRSYLFNGDRRDLDAFTAAGATVRAARGDLAALLENERDVQILAAISARHRAFESVAAREIALRQAGSVDEALRVWRDDGAATKGDLEAAVEDLARWHEQQTRRDVETSGTQSLIVQVLSLGLVCGGAAGALLLGRRMTRRITGRLVVLATQAEALRAGDLAARSPTLGNDELALLGAELNRMADEVEESHRRLALALEETRRREAELRVLNSLAATVARSLDLDLILEASLDQVCDLLGIEAADIRLLDAATGELTPVAERGFPTPEVGAALARPHASLELVAGAVAMTGEAIVVDEFVRTRGPGGGGEPTGSGALVPLLTATPVATAGYRAVASVPMCSREAAVGVLTVATREPRRFAPTEVNLLTAIANQIAVAVENARLYGQARALGVAEERNRLAREIHDTLAQGLTGITLHLEWAEAVLDDDPEQARAGLLRALGIARTNLEEARRSVLDLRAAPLDGQTLAEALRRLVDAWGREHGVPATFAANCAGQRFPARVEAGLYRVAQEALANIARHAAADQVTVLMSHRDGQVGLLVEDDGIGFDTSAPIQGSARGGFGLVGLRERVALLGGSLNVQSGDGRGTSVHVTVPDGEPADAARDRDATEALTP